MISRRFVKPMMVAIGLFAMLAGCDQTIDPFELRDFNYSVQGPLYMEDSPSYIRVHDTRSFLNAESTRELNISLTMTDLSTDRSILLTDSVKQFNDIYTHNFVVDEPLKYNNRYRFTLEDPSGLVKSFTSVTTKRSEITIKKDMARCEEPLQIELTNLDLTAGETIREEVAIFYNNQWNWAELSANRIFIEDNGDGERLLLSWTPNDITEKLLTGFHNYEEFDELATCDQLLNNVIRFRITHTGYVEDVEGKRSGNQNERFEVKPIRVRSTYTLEGEFTVDPSVFTDS